MSQATMKYELAALRAEVTDLRAKLAEAEREADERMAADHASLVEWEERAATEERRAIAVEAKLAEAERSRDALKMANISNVTRRDQAEARVEALEKALRAAREIITEADTSLGVPDVSFIDAALSGKAP